MYPSLFRAHLPIIYSLKLSHMTGQMSLTIGCLNKFFPPEFVKVVHFAERSHWGKLSLVRLMTWTFFSLSLEILNL